MYHVGSLNVADAAAPPVGRAARKARLAPAQAMALLLALGLLGAMLTVSGGFWPGDAPKKGKPAVRALQAVRPLDPEGLIVADPAQIEALTRTQALGLNAARPVSTLPNPPARAFILAGDAPGYARALACLTAAVYYEAAYEPVDGQRAVAQVVLNRVRHPLYPHTVCGVVFQGAERATGCQFTFTCDGSLARAPVPAVWARARAVAQRALAGWVAPEAGLSTHYHADYVVPYWSAMLVKTAVIGQHAFYRMPEGYGRPAAFVSRYAQAEPHEAFGMAAALAGMGDAAILPAPLADAGGGARPVLDQAGEVVGQSARPGDASREAGGGGNSASMAPSGKNVGRWVVGIDGGRAPSAPSIVYESTN